MLPDVPTIAEAGVPGYDTGVWWGLLGPANMPADVVAKLSHDFVAAVNAPAVKDRLGGLGASPIGSSAPEFEAQIHADYDKWGPIIKAAEIKPQ
jgi:tripartite-type tricarboxylate transporter receptor subunit TctC